MDEPAVMVNDAVDVRNWRHEEGIWSVTYKMIRACSLCFVYTCKPLRLGTQRPSGLHRNPSWLTLVCIPLMVKQMRFVPCAFPNKSWWLDDAKKFIFILNSYCFHNSCSLTILQVCVVLKFSFVFHNNYWALSLSSNTSNHSLPHLTILVPARHSLHSTSALLCNQLFILSLPLMLAAPLVGFFFLRFQPESHGCIIHIISHLI